VVLPLPRNKLHNCLAFVKGFSPKKSEKFTFKVKLPAASCGASVTKSSGTPPERDTRLPQAFGAVTSRFLPAASCGASARRRVIHFDSIRDAVGMLNYRCNIAHRLNVFKEKNQEKINQGVTPRNV